MICQLYHRLIGLGWNSWKSSHANAPEQYMQLEEEEYQYEEYSNFNSDHNESPEKAQERQIVRAPI